MTVVLGHHFFQGIVVVADSRSTLQKKGSIVALKDNAQKIFFLTPNIIIGFAGDIEFAGSIIPFLVQQIKIRPRLNLLNNFVLKSPKLIRYAYNILAKKKGHRPIGFIIAGLDPSRPAPVKDKDGHVTGHLGIYDKKIFKISAPSFIPIYANAADPIVIMGSGEPGIVGLEEDFRKMQFGQVLPSLGFQAAIISTALMEKIKSLGISTVGGLAQIAIIDTMSSRFQPYQGKRDPYGQGDLDVEMLIRNGRFIQKDLKTGKEMMLLYPPEVLQIKEEENDLFAELDNL